MIKNWDKRRYSFEFRDPGWYAPLILKILAKNNISLCISDHHDAPAPWRRTADFVYIRGHGPGGRHRGNYPANVLTDWARRITVWRRQGRDVYVYFDNDQKSAAPADALKLHKMLLFDEPVRTDRQSRRPDVTNIESGQERMLSEAAAKRT